MLDTYKLGQEYRGNGKVLGWEKFESLSKYIDSFTLLVLKLQIRKNNLPKIHLYYYYYFFFCQDLVISYITYEEGQVISKSFVE